MQTTDDDRLKRLLGYLDADPLNAQLLTDAAEAAIACGELDTATELSQRLIEVRPDDIEGPYLASVVAMGKGEFAKAVPILEALHERHDLPNIRFNLAWARAMTGDKQGLDAILDRKTVEAIPAAAMLKVQLRHEAGEFEEAMECGRDMLALHPDDPGLNAAMATLAMDNEDIALARQCARKAGEHPEALAASAMLDLHDGDPQTARSLFDQSLARREHNPRAWIGRGLASLVEHDASSAARDIDQGAQQFGDHIGSWIAAGWAHFLAGNREAARQRFERALAIDNNFAESHGSLAVIDVVNGDTSGARRKAATALRLDPECFSATLARVLMTSDDPARAETIVQEAMNRPLNDSGLTIASFMAGLAKPTVH